MRLCVFCGVGRLSLEHMIPRWVAETYPNDPTAEFRAISYLKGGAKVTRWMAPKLDYAVRKVCRRCNTGWMRELENRAAPLLMPMFFDQPKFLSPAEQETVAIWAFKTLLALRLAHSESQQFPQRYYRDLRATKERPVSLTVWLARVVTPPPSLSYFAEFHEAHLPAPNGPPVKHDAYVGTILIHKLAMQIFFHDLPDQEVSPILGLGAYEAALLRVSPARRGSVRWPPIVSLDEMGWRGLEHLFKAPPRRDGSPGRRPLAFRRLPP